jgi:hypothetical protein
MIEWYRFWVVPQPWLKNYAEVMVKRDLARNEMERMVIQRRAYWVDRRQRTMQMGDQALAQVGGRNQIQTSPEVPLVDRIRELEDDEQRRNGIPAFRGNLGARSGRFVQREWFQMMTMMMEGRVFCRYEKNRDQIEDRGLGRRN